VSSPIESPSVRDFGLINAIDLSLSLVASVLRYSTRVTNHQHSSPVELSNAAQSFDSRTILP
jgi:hypothetical protein